MIAQVYNVAYMDGGLRVHLFMSVLIYIGQTILKEQKIVGLHVHVHGTRLIYMYMYMYMHVAIRPVDPYDNRLAVLLTKHVCQVNTIQYALQ